MHTFFSKLITVFCLSLMTWHFVYACELPKPKGLKATKIQSCTMDLKWKAVNGATGYAIQYKTQSATNWSTLEVGNVITCSIAQLIPSTLYLVKIAAVCSPGDIGAFSQPEKHSLSPAQNLITWLLFL